MLNNIKVIHLGEDYSTIEVDGKEFEASLGLGEAILELQSKYIYTPIPIVIGEIITQATDDGDRKRKVVANNQINIVTLE